MDNSSSMPPMDQFAIRLTTVLYFVELMPAIPLFFVSLINAWMIWHSAFLHRNLKAILLIQSLFIVIYAIGRIMFTFWLLIFGEIIFTPMPILSDIALETITCSNLIGHVLIVERTMATLNARHYEHYKSISFTLGWMSLLAFFILLQLLLPSFGNTREFGFAVVITHLALVFSAIELIIFAVLTLHNRNRYNLFRNIHANYTHKYHLSERYQLLANIHSGKQLSPSFLFHLINICCSNAACVMMVYVTIPTDIFAVLFAAIMVIHSSTKLAIEITVITFHPLLRRKLSHGCAFLALRLKSIRIGTLRRTAVSGSDGVMPAAGIQQQPKEEERRQHFRVLEHFWQ